MKILRLAAFASFLAHRLFAQDAAPKEGALQASRDLEPTEVHARLELMQHEIYGQRVDQAWLLFNQLYGAQVRADRVLFPANTPEKEMIPGYVFTPAAGIPAGQKRPALLIIHGAFHTNFEWRWFKIVAQAVQQGYAVMFPEYRGSSGYGSTIFTNDYGTTDVADCLAAADYLAKQPFVDAKRCGLLGHSRGGMITVRLIQKYPQRFQAAVQVCALLDFVAYMSYKPDSRRREVAEDKGFGGKLPDKNLPAYIEVSPINFVPAIQTPLLCLASTGDKLVPLALNTERLIDLLKAHGKTYEAHIYKGAPGGHSFLFADTEEARDSFKRSYEFLGKYLKP
ncbi:MAG: S9 family peptidase [Verrucomicrobia bacterium]|nr:S9 family peptidase [Verrucomicrobiota bacterium]